jgi:hypothetical protein
MAGKNFPAFFSSEKVMVHRPFLESLSIVDFFVSFLMPILPSMKGIAINARHLHITKV